jgi:hypothetical protein
MLIYLGASAVLYLAAAAYFWEAKVMRSISDADVAACQSDAELIAMIEGNAVLQLGKRDGTLAYFILKGVFVLAWPVWLVVGLLRAKVA